MTTATLEKRGGLDTVKPSIRENPAPEELRSGPIAIGKAVQIVFTLISWFIVHTKKNQLQRIIRDE